MRTAGLETSCLKIKRSAFLPAFLISDFVAARAEKGSSESRSTVSASLSNSCLSIGCSASHRGIGCWSGGTVFFD